MRSNATLIWSLRAQAGRFRAIGLGCAIVIVLQFVLGGKPYYPGGAYTTWPAFRDYS